MHHVFLVPGFFGFSNLGDVKYFRAVRETLERNFTQRGERVAVFGVKTLPTGSLRRRAHCVLDAIVQQQSLKLATHIHLVGHSTGGIDARLVASTTADADIAALASALDEKLQTVVTLCSPHYGTPLASFFTTLYGKKLLYFITLLVFVGLWREPIAVAGGVLGLGFKVYDLLGLNESLLRQMTNQLLKDFTREREREVRAYLDSILADTSLMVQLTPSSMDVLNAAIRARDGIRHISYATVSPPPLKALSRSRLSDLLTPLTTLLYSTLYTLTANREGDFGYHPPVDARSLVTGLALPFDVGTSANDGVVPALSQIHGEFRGFLMADHLDVVGHYLRGPLERRDGADWFKSGARFNLDDFEALWMDVTDVLVRRK